ncbi:MAG: pyruvate kinase [Bradymonadales bacterium]|nr:MAG: pyruvate kinase [Bradymonadales bacterium]
MPAGEELSLFQSNFYEEIDLSFGPLDPQKVDKKKTKIIGTLGPASSTPNKIRQLIRSGMNVARLNFSHGDQAFHAENINMVRKVSEELGRFVGILQDIQGPKIRLGKLKSDEVHLKAGQKLTITTEKCLGSETRISCSHSKLHQEIKVGHRILIDDGLILLRVNSVKGREIRTEVVFGGPVKNNKGMNFPDTRLSVSCLTPKDRVDLKFGIKSQVDFIALSFVSDGSDVMAVRRYLKSLTRDIPPLIAKIETQHAVHCLEEILEAADGVMVARGDLGVECPLEQVPALQKKIIRSANRAGKIVITATQMLESMVWNPRPTRAEASDVANAVLDGSDAVMLSAETATGRYPVESVQTMSRILLRTEEFAKDDDRIQNARLKEAKSTVAKAVTAAAVQSTKSLEASAIVAFTQSGRTPRIVSQFRPKPKIFALSPLPKICRRLTLNWGVTPALSDQLKHTDDMPRLSKKVLRKHRLWKKGSRIVMLSGTPVAKPGSTNLLKVHEIQTSS